MILDLVAGVCLLLLVVTWLVYPLAVWVAGRLRRETLRRRVAPGPSVAVVVASRDVGEAIRARVDNCLDTSYEGPVTVVVALDRAPAAGDAVITDGLEGRVCVVCASGAGKAAALNEGVASSTGEILVFADTWQRFEPETISRLVGHLSDPSVGAVSGKLRIPATRARLARVYWAYESWLRRNEARLHSSIGVTGAVYAMRKELWQPLPPGLLLDDVYVPMQVVLGGRRIAYAETAVAVETRTSLPRQEYVRKVRTLTGVMQLCAWLPAVLVPWRNPVWLQFVMHKLARFATPYATAGIGVWVAVRAFPLLVPYGVPVGLGGGALVAWIALGRGAGALRLREAVSEAALLHAAFVVAVVNGFRGRWSIWHG